MGRGEYLTPRPLSSAPAYHYRDGGRAREGVTLWKVIGYLRRLQFSNEASLSMSGVATEDMERGMGVRYSLSPLQKVQLHPRPMLPRYRFEQTQCIRRVVEVGGLDRGVRVAARDVDDAGGDALAGEVDGGDVGVALREDRGVDRDALALGGLQEQALQGGMHDVAASAAAAEEGDHRAGPDVDRQFLGEMDVGRAGGGQGVHDDRVVGVEAVGDDLRAAQTDLLLHRHDAVDGAAERHALQAREEAHQQGAGDPVVDRLAGDAVGVGEAHDVALVGDRVADLDPLRPRLRDRVEAEVDVEVAQWRGLQALVRALHMPGAHAHDAAQPIDPHPAADQCRLQHA